MFKLPVEFKKKAQTPQHHLSSSLRNMTPVAWITQSSILPIDNSGSPNGPGPVSVLLLLAMVSLLMHLLQQVWVHKQFLLLRSSQVKMWSQDLPAGSSYCYLNRMNETHRYSTKLQECSPTRAGLIGAFGEDRFYLQWLVEIGLRKGWICFYLGYGTFKVRVSCK